MLVPDAALRACGGIAAFFIVHINTRIFMIYKNINFFPHLRNRNFSISRFQEEKNFFSSIFRNCFPSFYKIKHDYRERAHFYGEEEVRVILAPAKKCIRQNGVC